jgi:polyribonucleotide nucleotidyltransferase
MARQADGAVLATYGETIVLATVGRVSRSRASTSSR